MWQMRSESISTISAVSAISAVSPCLGLDIITGSSPKASIYTENTTIHCVLIELV